MRLPSDPHWFRSAAVYQVYPRSFQDSNGDGIGDLPGLLSRLDHIADLGVDAVWLCPVFASPQDDNGYDISGYQSIDPTFGTLADFDAVVKGLHDRGLKLILDMVLNHTSDEHPWFVESASSRTSPKRDWYHWQPASPEGGAPNRWGSFFGGSAWERLGPEGDYYLHLFGKKQPDLNWECPELRAELFAMMRWWLDRGVDGFRLDVVNLISKVPGYPEGDEDRAGGPFTSGFCHVANGPRIHEFLADLDREVLAPYGAVAVGETPGVDPATAQLYTDPARKELDLVFQFELMDLDAGPKGKFQPLAPNPARTVASQRRWQEGLDRVGWNSLYWNNHDQPRLISRFGDPAHREASGAALAAFLYLQKGTPFLYQGEELGMLNLPFRGPEDLRDVESLNFLAAAAQDPRWTRADAWAGVLARGRDHARHPYCWAPVPGAGFTTGTPWIGVHPAAALINAEESRSRPGSLWHFYRQLLAFRKAEPLVWEGTIAFVEGSGPLFAYARYRPEEPSRALWVGAVLASTEAEGPEGWGQGPVLTGPRGSGQGTRWAPWELRVWYGPAPVGSR